MKAILPSFLLLAVLAGPPQAAAQGRGGYHHSTGGLAVVAATLGVLNLVVQPQGGYYVASPGPRYYRQDTDLLLYGSGGRSYPYLLRPRHRPCR